MYDLKSTKFMQLYKDLGNKYGCRKVFEDFVKMAAIAIYNSFANNQEQEKEYLETINKYRKEDQVLFSQMLAELVIIYGENDEIKDILGEIYSNNNFGESRLGQVFTPAHISDLMAKVVIENAEKLVQKIESEGFISLSEPCCGAGGTILSFARALKEENINYQQNLFVEAIDISSICVYMTYIQLSLYGIPAVVYCGETLSRKMRFKLETPMFFMQYWKFRRFYMQDKNEVNVKENECAESRNEEIVEKQNLFKEVTVKGNIQVSLW